MILQQDAGPSAVCGVRGKIVRSAVKEHVGEVDEFGHCADFETAFKVRLSCRREHAPTRLSRSVGKASRYL